MLHHEEDVDIVPANMELSGLEVSLSNTMSREMILKDYIDSSTAEFLSEDNSVTHQSLIL